MRRRWRWRRSGGDGALGFFSAGGGRGGRRGGNGREARVRWIRLLGLTPWTTSTGGSSGSSNSGDGGGGGSRALSLALSPSPSLSLPPSPSLSLAVYLRAFSPFFLSRSRSRSLSLAFVSSLSLSLSLSSHLLRLCSTRLSTVLLVFLTKDPLNTSAVITSRHPSRVARLPRQTHPQPSALRLHGAHRPSRPTSHHLAPPRSHSSSQFLTFRSTFPSGREPGTA